VSDIIYHLVRGEKVDNIVVFNPSQEPPIFEADSNHPHWQAIMTGLKNNDTSIFELFDVQGGMVKRLKVLSDRVEYDGRNILFDGDVINSALADQILRFIQQGVGDYAPLVRFWEKLASNPNEHSRDQLYRWLKTHDFTITDNGDIVGYKGVIPVLEDRLERFESVHAGKAHVDGKEISGRIPNNPGSIVTMPRSEVMHNPRIGCHTGLHVGTWAYAQNFGHGAVLEVHVNPRDIVSIPTDCSDAKMRCCKYKVVQKLGKHYDGKAVRPAEDYAWSGDVGYSPA
jgi:hypothetical protein